MAVVVSLCNNWKIFRVGVGFTLATFVKIPDTCACFLGLCVNLLEISVQSMFQALRIALIYILFGGSWILFSDYFVGLVVDSPAVYSQVQTIKGWLFILVTGALLFVLIRRTLKRQQRDSDEIRHQNELIQRILAVSPSHIALLDECGICRYASDSFAAHLAAADATLIGRDLVQALRPEIAAHMETALATAQGGQRRRPCGEASRCLARTVRWNLITTPCVCVPNWPARSLCL